MDRLIHSSLGRKIGEHGQPQSVGHGEATRAGSSLTLPRKSGSPNARSGRTSLAARVSFRSINERSDRWNEHGATQGRRALPTPPGVRVGWHGVRALRSTARRARLHAQRDHQAAASAIRERREVRRDVFGRGEPGRPYPSSQRRRNARRRRAGRRAVPRHGLRSRRGAAQARRRVEAARRGATVRHAVAAIVGALHGLHAAHEARNAQGEPLEIIDRDVSPQISSSARKASRASSTSESRRRERGFTRHATAPSWARSPIWRRIRGESCRRPSDGHLRDLGRPLGAPHVAAFRSKRRTSRR